jgi:thioredoxin-related protein
MKHTTIRFFILVFGLLFSGHLVKGADIIPNESIIQWVRDPSFQQVKERAKKENKYIFLDCYATWCGPCKRLDSDTYTDKDVANFLNTKFLSVRVQMDRVQRDDPYIKSWYDEAVKIEKEYKIEGYPTLIFLTPDGELVHQVSGYKNPDEFIEELKVAVEPGRKYIDPVIIYEQFIEKYKAGQKDLEQIPSILPVAWQKDQKFAEQLKVEYLEYLYEQPLDKALQMHNIKFIISYVNSSKEKGFEIIEKNTARIDSLLRKEDRNFSSHFLTRIIEKEEVTDQLWGTNGKMLIENPDWEILKTNLIKRGIELKTADQVMFGTRVRWYTQKKDWYNLANEYILSIENNGIGDAKEENVRRYINDVVLYIFLPSVNDVKQLKKATAWMEVLLKEKKDATTLHGYANLLYKRGLKEKAIKTEREAVKLSADPAYRKNLGKMEKGEVIWVDKK